MKKRIISLIIAIISIVSVLTVAVGAQESEVMLYGYRTADGSASEMGFVSFTSGKPKELDLKAAQGEDAEIYCGTSIAGVLYCIDAQGNLVKVDASNFNRTVIGKAIEDTSVITPVEMSYDNVAGRLYIICIDRNNVDANIIMSVDINSGNAIKLVNILGAEAIKGMAFNGKGVLYCVGENGTLYKVDVATGRAYTVAETGYSASYIQSMCYDRTTSQLYWANYDGTNGRLIAINPESGKTAELGTLGDNAAVTALCFANDAYEISIVSEEGGIAYVSGNGYFNSGEQASITAQADKGYSFGGWIASGGTLGATMDEETTITVPNGDVKIDALFVPKKAYQERSLYDTATGVTVNGKKVYYNAALTVYPWSEGSEGYTELQNMMGKKRELITTAVIELAVKSGQETEALQRDAKVLIPVGEQYNGQKVDIFRYDGEKVIKTSAKVKDNNVTVKIEKGVSLAITTHRGGSAVVAVILILLLLVLAFFIYVYRGTIKREFRKVMMLTASKINKLKAKKQEKSKAAKEEDKASEVMESLDAQDMENSRYNIE